ncbi:MAG: cupin domain-containing protein [Candidatus Obscuribacterales bacterium]|nr:cupin domain-containing protein [Candidatus Obscuribacterales bacterium]
MPKKIDLSASDLIQLLKLEEHPEGGYYRQTYKSYELIPREVLPPRYESPRSYGTSIYYLLTKETCSRLHKVASDETFHFYFGAPVEMLLLFPDNRADIVVLGHNILARQQPQYTVPKGIWQGSKILQDPDYPDYALMGTTVAPGFEYDDFELAKRAELLAEYKEFEKQILDLT